MKLNKMATQLQTEQLELPQQSNVGGILREREEQTNIELDERINYFTYFGNYLYKIFLERNLGKMGEKSDLDFIFLIKKSFEFALKFALYRLQQYINLSYLNEISYYKDIEWEQLFLDTGKDNLEESMKYLHIVVSLGEKISIIKRWIEKKVSKLVFSAGSENTVESEEVISMFDGVEMYFDNNKDKGHERIQNILNMLRTGSPFIYNYPVNIDKLKIISEILKNHENEFVFLKEKIKELIDKINSDVEYIMHIVDENTESCIQQMKISKEVVDNFDLGELVQCVNQINEKINNWFYIKITLLVEEMQELNQEIKNVDMYIGNIQGFKDEIRSLGIDVERDNSHIADDLLQFISQLKEGLNKYESKLELLTVYRKYIKSSSFLLRTILKRLLKLKYIQSNTNKFHQLIDKQK